MKCAKLIDDAAKRPNVAKFIVLLIMDLFWAHIVGSSYMCKGKLWFLVHNSCKTKVAELAVRVWIKKYVTRLQISMKNFLRAILIFRVIFLRAFLHAIVNLCSFCTSMAVIQSRHCLSQYLPYEVFSNMVLRLSASPYELLQVSTITMFHNDEYFGCRLVDESIIVLNDVCVA